MRDKAFAVRIGQFVPDAPPVDFLVDGYPVLTDRAFDTVPPYTEHEAATYEVGVRRSGSDELVLTEPITFEAGAYHTLLFVGTMGEPHFRLLMDGDPHA